MFPLCGNPSPADHVGILDMSQKGQQSPSSGLIQRPALLQAGFQNGKANFQHSGKSLLCLASHSGDSILEVKPLTWGAGRVLRKAGKLLVDNSLSHGLRLRQHPFRAGPAFHSQASQPAAYKTQGENSPFVGVCSPCGGQHPAFRQPTGKAKSGKCLLGRLISSPLSHLNALRKKGMQRCGAVQKRVEIHVLVAAAVLPVYQAGLGGDTHLVEKRPASEKGSGFLFPTKYGLFQ